MSGPSKEVAHEFGYSEGPFACSPRVWRDPRADLLFEPSPARAATEEVRRPHPHRGVAQGRTNSVYEIADALKRAWHGRSAHRPRAQVLRELGYAPCHAGSTRNARSAPPSVEPVADVRAFALAPRSFSPAAVGLFLFLPSWAPGSPRRSPSGPTCRSAMVPPATRARRPRAQALAIERKSHVMAWSLTRGWGCSAA